MNGLEIYQNVLTPDQCNQLIKLFGDDDRKESGKILSPEGLKEILTLRHQQTFN